MFTSLLTTAFLFFPLFANAANDWTTPCAGSCAYETGDGTKTAWGSILLDGTPEVISDISTAAGWSIMDCNSTSQNTQTVRLVCHNPDAGCAQLFTGGAENTIVRLPEECADAPFARVANVTTSTNQTLTAKVAERVARKKRSTAPEVMTVILDYNFHLLPSSRGTVSMTALATTNPLQRNMADAQNLRRSLGYGEDGSLNARSANSPSELVKRELLRRDLFSSFISGNQIPAGTTAAAFNSSTVDKTRKLAIGHWNDSDNKTFNVLNVQQSFPVIDAGLNCPQSGNVPAFNAKFSIEADVTVQATVSVGFIIAGTIIPPAITKAAFTSALDGSAQVDFKVSTVAQGSFDTGLIPLWTSGMAGLSIPGILDVGPTFSINGQGTGDISVCTDAVIAANYQFPGLGMVYPQDQGQSTGSASQGTSPSPLSLSIGGSASLSGTVSAHVIPRVDLGVSVLSGAASASVFLEVDGYGTMNMSLSMAESATTTVPPVAAAVAVLTTTSTPTSNDTLSTDTTQPSNSSTLPTATPTPDSVIAPLTSDSSTTSSTSNFSIASSSLDTSTSTTMSLPIAADDLALPPADDSASFPNPDAKEGPQSCPTRRVRRLKQKRDVIVQEKRGTSPVYSGCVGMAMGVKISAGAQGKLLSIWKDSTSYDLFSQEWSLLNKCFKTNSKRSLPYRHGPIIPSRPSPSLPRRGLVDNLICPLIQNAITDALTADNQLV